VNLGSNAARLRFWKGKVTLAASDGSLPRSGAQYFIEGSTICLASILRTQIY